MDEERGLRAVLARLLARPDELMLEVGAGGELLVARLRALLSLLLLPVPLLGILFNATSYEAVAGLVGAIFANLAALGWLALARRRRRYPWLPFATGTYDVTSITALLAVLAASEPAAGPPRDVDGDGLSMVRVGQEMSQGFLAGLVGASLRRLIR